MSQGWRERDEVSISAASRPGTCMIPRLSKLKYRAWRRGFLEADLILGPFADQHLESMTPAELDAFESLLDQPDHDVYGWIVGQATAPEAHAGRVLTLIQDFRLAAHASRDVA